jgi:hypothetical protein
VRLVGIKWANPFASAMLHRGDITREAAIAKWPVHLRSAGPHGRGAPGAEVQSGHDAWVVGDEAGTSVEFSGAKRYATRG